MKVHRNGADVQKHYSMRKDGQSLATGQVGK